LFSTIRAQHEIDNNFASRGNPVSEKKEGKAKAAPAPRAAPKQKKAKVHPSIKVERASDGSKIMATERGSERARRRAGLKRDWKTHPNVPQMLPTKAEEAAKAVN
jgi:hypothetical protein